MEVVAPPAEAAALPITFDTETALIRPGLQAPPLVCMSFDAGQGGGVQLVDHAAAVKLMESFLASGRLLVGHNVAYDFGVFAAEAPHLLPAIFQAYEEGRVTDTMIRQKLIDIAEGRYRRFFSAEGKAVKVGYGLADLCRRHLEVELPKTEIRLSYGPLRGVPLSEWPELVQEYALSDAAITALVYEVQQEGRWARYLNDQYRQAAAAWWIRLMSAWGLRTDQEGVRRFAEELQGEFDEIATRLLKAGMIRKNGTRDTKAVKAHLSRVCMAQGREIVLTPKMGVALAADVCEATGDELLVAYARLSSLKKQLSTDIPLLEQGMAMPIHPHFETLAETGRTTSSPNVQNLPVYGKMRECFVPRPGCVYAAADFDGFELRTMAQVCVSRFGKSKLAEALNAGLDPHLVFAAKILKITYEEAVARHKASDDLVYRARQTAKVLNFGAPGGLGAESLCVYAKKNYGVSIEEKDARVLKDEWRALWPEFNIFFARISDLCETEDPQLVQLFANRFRGGVTYTEACNCLDAETEALTKRGWVRGFDLVPGDFLLTKNAKTGKLDWEPISRMLLHPNYVGPLVEFKTKNFSAVTTPEHRWLVTTHDGQICCKRTSEIGSNGDYRIHRNGDYLAPGTSPYTDDFVELVGWVLTDGSIAKGVNRVSIYQSERANLPKVRQIDRLLKRLGLHPNRRRVRQGGVAWTLSGKCNYVPMLKEMFPDRTLKISFLLQLTKQQLRTLFKTMMLGDGTVGLAKQSFSARSAHAAEMFQILCTMNGWSSKARWIKGGYIPKPSSKIDNIPISRGIWTVQIFHRDTVQVVNLSRKYGKSKTLTKQRIEFHGACPVWCPVVRNTYFVARREGGVFITGNSEFQGLASDCAKISGFLIAKACYVNVNDVVSPLFGSRIVNFVHDEFIVEAPEASAPEAAEELARLMVVGAGKFLPDVPPKASPLLMRRWSKRAKALRGADGRLVPWEG